MAIGLTCGTLLLCTIFSNSTLQSWLWVDEDIRWVEKSGGEWGMFCLILLHSNPHCWIGVQTAESVCCVWKRDSGINGVEEILDLSDVFREHCQNMMMSRVGT